MRVRTDDAHGAVLPTHPVPLLPLGRDLCVGATVASVMGKAEHLNLTGSFKDRIAAAAVALADERGLAGCMGTSSGNGGAALAAYSAAAGRKAVLFVRSDIVPAKLAEIRAYGAAVYRLDVGRDDGAAIEEQVSSIVDLATSSGWLPFVTAYRFLPEAMDAAKSIAYEIADAAPGTTVVYVPVGGGGLLTAIHRGFLDVAEHLPNGPPRLVGVQPTGCATLRPALNGSDGHLRTPLTTTVSGLQVAVLFDAAAAVAAVTDSGGHAVEVSDADIWRAQSILARREGVLVEPAGATATAGLLADARAGRLQPDDHAVVILSGAGYKDAAALQRLGGSESVPVIGTTDIPGVLDRFATRR